MIILYKDNFNRYLVSELVGLIQDIKPNWTHSFKEYKSEADVKVLNYEGDSLGLLVEGLAESTEELVIGIDGRECISECPKEFHAGMTDVKEHIRTYTYGK